MGKRELKKYIRQREGLILSEGTLRPEDLLSTVYDFLQAWGIRFNKKDILDLFEYESEYNLSNQVYWNKARLKESFDDYDAWETWQEISDFLNDIAPSGYYFGSHPGDGACIGFFRVEVED